MRVLLAAILAGVLISDVSAQGVTGNRISVPAGAPNKSPGIWVSATSPISWPNVSLPSHQWHVIDLNDGPHWNGWVWNLPATTVAVELAGILIITNASATPCEVRATFRAPGDALSEWGYQMQTGAAPFGGSRSNAVVTVPVIAKKFEFFWWHNCELTPASGVGMNLMVQKVIWNAPE